MIFSNLISQLRPIDSISTDFPCITALEKEVINTQNTPPILCAVMVLLFLDQNNYYLTLIQRPDYKGVHSGQIAFAGGKKDKTDTSLVATALRECEEEIGVTIAQEHLLGGLPDVYIVPSHSLVTPIVALLPHKPSYTLSSREVAYVIEVKLDDLLNPANQSMQAIKVLNNREIKLPAYKIGSHLIWGATGRMINLFLDKWS
jgi:8-oxo-dGTP pyrophosphatase MutT (NUDIX family)